MSKQQTIGMPRLKLLCEPLSSMLRVIRAYEVRVRKVSCALPCTRGSNIAIASTAFPIWASSAPKAMKSAAKKYLFTEISQFGQARDLGALSSGLIDLDQTDLDQTRWVATSPLSVLIVGVRRQDRMSASGT
jgi:hypothetical protein